MKRHLFAAVLAVMAAPMAQAATSTFGFSGQVTSGAIPAGTTTFGNTGDAATARLSVTADPTDAIPVGLVAGGLVEIDVMSPDFSYSISFLADGFNDGFNSSIDVNASRAFFATSSGSFTFPNNAGNTLRTTFLVDFGVTLGAVPATYGELVGALSLPTTTATFVTNGDFLFSVAPGIVADEYRATFSPTAVVPVPAPLILLLTGVAAVAGARRWTARS